MPIAFLGVAQTRAPLVAPEILAGVIGRESRFAPFRSRLNSGHPLKGQPSSRPEAIEVATPFVAERHDLQPGFGGVGVAELQRLTLSASGAFAPGLNRQATAALPDRCYRLGIKNGVDPARAEQVMPPVYYGRDHPSVGAIVNDDDHARQDPKRLLPIMVKFAVRDMGEARKVSSPRASSPVGTVAEMVAANTGTETASAAATPRWDIANIRGRSFALVFQDNQKEKSE